MSQGYQDLIPTKSAPQGKSDDYSDLIPTEKKTEAQPQQKEKEPTLIERGKEVGKQTVFGGVGGYFAPELMETAGVGAQALGRGLAGAPGVGGFVGRASTGLGTGLITGAEALRASRLGRTASTVGGAFSGGAGETAGQIVEAKYGPGLGAETARLLTSVVAPMPFEYLGSAGGKLFGTLLGSMGVPGMGKAKILGDFLQERGISPRNVENLSEAKRKILDEKVKALRFGDERSKAAEIDIVNLFKGEAGKITATAEQQALQLEQQAKQIADEAERKGGQITADMEKRVANLRSQFDFIAEKIRSDATAQSQELVTAASKRASLIRKNAENQRYEVRQLSEIEAQDAIVKAQQQADQLIKNSERQVAQAQSRIEFQKQRLTKFERGAAVSREQQITQIGEPILPTEIGKQTRSIYDQKLKQITTNRDTVTETPRLAWQNSVDKKEASGKDYRGTKAYQQEIENLNSLLVNKETKMLMQTDEKVKSAINGVLNSINPQRVEVAPDGTMVREPLKASVKALEVVYRRLKDRASGLPAEGVEAIDQQLAGKLAKPLEKIIDEFSEGTYSAFKNAWKDASQELNQFRTNTARFVTDKPEGFDLGNYLERLSSVGGQVFGNASAAQQLVSVAGKDEANRLAQGYLADQIGTATPDKIRTVLYNNRDWLKLPEFKALNDQLEKVATGVAKAKSQEERSAILQKALGVRLERLPSVPVKEAERIEKAGVTQAGRVQTQAEKRLRDIEKQEQAKMERFGAPSTEKLRTESEQQITAAAPLVERQAGEMRLSAREQAQELEKRAKQAGETLTDAASLARKSAQDRVNTLLSNTTDETRFEQILLGSKQDEWQMMGDIINSNPQIKNTFAQAVGQVVARKAESSLKSARDSMESLGERLINFGLMDQASVESLKKQLNDIYVMPISTQEKVPFIVNTIKKILTGYVVPGIERIQEKLSNK
jgi:hypothetical protein